VQSEKSSGESCKEELRFLKYLFQKVKGFDGFSLKERDLITVFKQMKSFHPQPEKAWGPHVPNLNTAGMG
jgi:hypothetical protein